MVQDTISASASSEQYRSTILKIFIKPANRWHVGSVFGRLLSSITDEEEGLMARDVLPANPRAAEWIKVYCTGGLLRVIKDGFPNESG